jgi:hypothetical protein
MAMGSTQTLTVPGISPGGADCLEILGASTSWNTKGLSRRVRIAFTFTLSQQSTDAITIPYSVFRNMKLPNF